MQTINETRPAYFVCCFQRKGDFWAEITQKDHSLIKFPRHGKMKCATCFGNRNTRKIKNWKIRNDPGHWGSRNPKYLILGFSKGATQQDIYDSGNFDDIAFGGKQCRSNLSKILQSVGLLSKNETVDQKIKKTEKDFAFASLVRCSVSRKFNGKYITSGSLITRSFKEIPEIISTCINKYLTKTPNRLSIIIMLGISDKYIEECRKAIKNINRNRFNEINDVAYIQNNKLFVHIAHPSPGNGHIKDWISGKSTVGKKKRLAEDAIKFGFRRSVSLEN